MGTQCMDDPSTLLQKEWCLSAVSKDMAGLLTLMSKAQHACHVPLCTTLKTVHKLELKTVKAHAPCDAAGARPLNGKIVVDRLITVFDVDGLHRGFHTGDFVWTGAVGVQVTGRMAGITNSGTHRLPAFTDCQKCDDKGVMEGRLCGQISSTSNPALNGCQVVANYRIKFEASTGAGQGEVRATLEGIVLCACQQ